MAVLRSEPLSSISGISIVSVTDFLVDAEERESYLGETNLIELDLGDVGRVLARPSGTEPKLKIYVDLRTDFPADGGWVPAEETLARRAGEVGKYLADWLEFAMTDR